MVTVKQVKSKKDLKQFISFYYDLNRSDHTFIGDSFKNQRKLMSTGLNPFFEHAEVCYFLAIRMNRVVGRIAVVKNRTGKIGVDPLNAQFGFFDCINEGEVAQGLVNAAKEQARKWGFSGLEGPENFSFNDSLGILVEGFNHSPFYEMPYNQQYYDQLLRDCGFKKTIDLLAYYIASKDFPHRLIKAKPILVSRFAQRGIRIRNFNPSKFTEEVDAISGLYNKAWVSNQGFVPVTGKEFQSYFKKYKSFLDPDLIFIAEKEGRIIGFALTLPNLNDVYATYKRGRKPLQDLLFEGSVSRKINTIRIVAIGIDKEYRRMGIDSYFYLKIFETAQRKGYVAGEASRVMENNEMMTNAMSKMDAQLYKRYRLYKLTIS